MKLYQYWMLGVMTLTTACTDELGTVESASTTDIRNAQPQQNELGIATTISTQGSVDLTNEFFQDLGVNGRHCGSCHAADQGWTVSAEGVQKTFDRTGGLDPIFRNNDGSNSPTADVSTEGARREAFSMLLSRGVIRVGIGIPAGADFTLVSVVDPYNYASAAELSLFRRPLPSANLKFIPAVMWDGRVTAGAASQTDTIDMNLSDQSNGATQGHAAAPLPISQPIRDSIVGFETALFNAQVVTHDAGRLDAEGALGGPAPLVTQQPQPAADLNVRWNLFDAWATSDNAARRAVFRGQELFNTRQRDNTVANANGGNTCRFCHSVQNVGANRRAAPTIANPNPKGTFFNVNVSDNFGDTDMPLYTLKRNSDGALFTTTDPGRALITGLIADIGKFKVPALRALGSRAPYFHNGSAATLADVVNHYRTNLAPNKFTFTDAEAADLVAFLEAL
jgi:cytochrome c peroxidase